MNVEKLERQLDQLDRFMLNQYRKQHEATRWAQRVSLRLPLDRRAASVARITGVRNKLRARINRLEKRAKNAAN